MDAQAGRTTRPPPLARPRLARVSLVSRVVLKVVDLKVAAILGAEVYNRGRFGRRG